MKARRSQARPRYVLRSVRPTRIDRYRLNWPREMTKLVLSVAMVIGAVLVWVVKPWL